jgi:hypothetical protein
LTPAAPLGGPETPMTTAYDPRHKQFVDHQRLYPSVESTSVLHRSWDITITAAGAEGDVWTLAFNGGSIQFTNLAIPTTSTVATGLRAAAAALVGVTVTGATTHVILTLPAQNGVEDWVIAAPVLTVSPAGGTSSQAAVGASDTTSWGVSTVDQK